MEIREIDLHGLAEKFDRLERKFGSYFSFTISSGINYRDGGRYFKWNIYTPVLSHNDFKTREAMVDFMDKILEKEPKDYWECKLALLRGRKSSAMEEAASLHREIEEVEKAAQDSGAISVQQTQARLGQAEQIDNGVPPALDANGPQE